MGLGPGPAVRSPSCPGGWSAEGQSCPGWHVVAVWGSSVCTVPRATQPGGAGGPGICPHKRIWLQAFVHPSGLLTEPSSTRQGWGQPCRTDAAGTWPRSHQTEDVGLVFTLLLISNPPTMGCRLSRAQETRTLERSCTDIWGSHMWPPRSPLGTWSNHCAYPVFQIGEVCVPAQRQAVDVGDSELGGHEEEVHQLRSRPHAPVSLRGGVECSERRGRAGPGGCERWGFERGCL